MTTVTPLDPAEAHRLAALALAEDLAGGTDVTTLATVPAGLTGTAEVVARADGVVAGLDVAAAVFAERLGSAGHVTTTARDGDRVRAGQVLLTVTGPTRELLTAERSALNLLTHLSGIATLTARWVDAVAGTGAVIRDTRKTLPGLRAAEKYAVRCGGGSNHRMGLRDQALIKDNHVLAAGGITAAMRAVRAAYPDVFCEVECDTLDQVEEAAREGAVLVLLDNMDVATTTAAVAIARRHGTRTEASGGLTLAVARAVAGTGVDYLAVGALTHSAPALDLGLDLHS
ncbi:MAG: carboxylating nicotinate-nucleotide diphosphorylase [Actinomycetota bacterium]|nr:carboxylating nicotinate-nucleotide diphosphorylase [Actinomycetota bacterium]